MTLLHPRPGQDLQFLADLLDQIPNAVIATDPHGKIIYWNGFADRLLGWHAAEVEGKDVRDLIFGRAERERHSHALKRMREEGTWQGETVVSRAGGESFPAILTLNLLKDQSGRPSVVLGTVTDLSEIRELEARLRQSRKMEAIGTLAAGAAHDFNNLLAAILGSVALLREQLAGAGARAEALGSIQSIEQTARRGKELAARLLRIARSEPARSEPVDVPALMDEAVRLVRARFPTGIDVRTAIGEGLPTLNADRGALLEALMHLVQNACEAMPGGGTITLKAEAASSIPPDRIEPASGSGQPFVVLTVTDGGTGMTPEVLEHAFEPFFTTRNPARQSGLGLSLVYAIARSHGGAVRLWSDHSGTRAAIYLPVGEPARDRSGGEESETRPVEDRLARYRGSEVILIIDDEAVVREVAGRILRKFGYKVLSAAGGREGLDLIESEGPVDMVLLDMVMPEMDGREVFRRLEIVHPEIPVLITSGYSVEGWVESLLRKGAAGFVKKPYEIAEFVRAVRDALDSSRQ